MPKLKTNKSVAKRVKVTKKGKVMRLHPGHSHLLSHKSRKCKRNLKKPVIVAKSFAKAFKDVLHQ